MENIDEKDLDIAITLGGSICKDLGVCCDKEGKVIFQIYKRLQKMHSQQPGPDQPETETEEPEIVSEQPLDFD